MTDYVLILKPFFDVVQGRERHPDEGVVEMDVERAPELIKDGYVRYVKKSHRNRTEKMDKGPPEDKSLSGPPENKRAKFKNITVKELRKIAEEDLGLDLPSGYIKRDELIDILLGAL